MCCTSGVIFGAVNVSREDIAGKEVLDVGSHDYNGNFYALYKHYEPKKFVGVDMIDGPGVDVVCRGEELVEKFGKESFDVVLSSELMEHARNWRDVISNMKQVCKPGGLIVLTTRSFGFPLHGFPDDYWRFEQDDMREIFSDCTIEVLESDPEAPGVFMKARKPMQFTEKDLSSIALYSVVAKERVQHLSEEVEAAFLKTWNRRRGVYNVFKKIEFMLYKLGRSILRP